MQSYFSEEKEARILKITLLGKGRILLAIVFLLLILSSLSVYSANPGSRPDKSRPDYIKPGSEYVQELYTSIRTKYTGNVQVLHAEPEPDTKDARQMVQDVVPLKLRYEKYPHRSELDRYMDLYFSGETEEKPVWEKNLKELLEPGPPINWEDTLKTFDPKSWDLSGSKKDWALVAREGSGTVESQKESEEAWSPIWQSRLLKAGDKIKTSADSSATIILPDETTITIPPNSEVLLTSEVLAMEPKTTSTKLRLMGGKLIVDVKRFFGQEDSWEITTPNGAMASRGTKYDISTDGEKTIVRVYEGEVIAISFYDFYTAAVITNDTIAIIKAGEQGILFSNKSTEVMPLVDAEPLEMVEGEPCKELLSSMVNALQPTNPSTREMLEEGKKKFYAQQSQQPRRHKDCILPPRPEFIFFTNKFLDSSTVNQETFIVLDEENKPVDGFFEVSSSITFIPSRPIFGDIMVTLKGGNKGICSLSQVCLEQDYTFRYNGTEKTPDFGSGLPFEITSAIPAIIKNNFVLANLGNITAENITLTLPAYKTRFPNIFIELKAVSPPLQYKVRESGENAFIDFYIPQLQPYELLPLNLTYSALALGIEYYSRLDVSNFESYDDKELLKTFTRLEENIEADSPEIASLAQAIVGEEKNPFWKAYKLYNWMTTNIGYDYERADRIAEETKKMLAGAKKSGIPPVSALDTLHKKKGVCYDYALLYIALARSAGIPSRMVILDVVSENGEVSGHSIVEIYLPRYGWIPLDPTWGTAFNNFAREEPFQFIDYKEDGITEPIAASTSAINGEGLNLLKSKEVSFIDAQSEEDWETLFQEPFFRELSQLIITSQLRKDLSAFEEYNQVLGQDLFALPGESKTSPVVLAEKAVTAYHQGRYEQVQPEVQERIAENINQSLIPFLLNAKIAQEFVIEERAGTTNKSYYDESLFLLSYALSRGDSIRESMAENDYTTAVNSLTATYYPTRTYLQGYSLNLVATDVYQKLVSSSFFAFGSASLKFQLLLLVFFIVLPAFWIWMMIHCLLAERLRHLNKFWWFIIIFFITPAGLIPLGPTLYFFLEYRKRNKTGGKTIK